MIYIYIYIYIERERERDVSLESIQSFNIGALFFFNVLPKGICFLILVSLFFQRILKSSYNINISYHVTFFVISSTVCNFLFNDNANFQKSRKS